jgi:hypothetical protein
VININHHQEETVKFIGNGDNNHMVRKASILMVTSPVLLTLKARTVHNGPYSRFPKLCGTKPTMYSSEISSWEMMHLATSSWLISTYFTDKSASCIR